MTSSPDGDKVRHRRSSRHARRNANARRKPIESSLEVTERLLHTPVDTVKDGEPTKMSTLEAILHQLLQKSLTGNKKADRALQKFYEFANRNGVSELEVVFVDNDYTKAFAASQGADDV